MKSLKVKVTSSLNQGRRNIFSSVCRGEGAGGGGPTRDLKLGG